MHEVVKAGTPFRVFGAAWTGDADVETVEVSVDSGKTWAKARLIDKPVRFSWRRWEYLNGRHPYSRGEIDLDVTGER